MEDKLETWPMAVDWKRVGKGEKVQLLQSLVTLGDGCMVIQDCSNSVPTSKVPIAVDGQTVCNCILISSLLI